MSRQYVLHKKLNEKGLIQVIIMMGLVMVSLMGLMATSLQGRKQQIVVESKLSSDILQQNIAMYLQDNEGWKNTINDSQNTSFACLRDGSDCPKSAQPIKILRNSNNEIVVDTASDKGIKADGTICSGYSKSGYASPNHEGEVNGACQIHVGLTWTPLCKGVCKNPRFIQVNVAVDRAVSTASSARFLASNLTTVTRKPTYTPNVSQIGVGKFHTCALAEGTVYCWGDNSGGQLGLGTSGGSYSIPQKVTGVPAGVTKISVGMGGACVIQAGNVWCWGWYFGGAPRMINDVTTGAPLQNAVGVSWQNNHGCAMTSNGAAYCWGSNMYGQVGYASPPLPTVLFWDGYNTWFGANGPAFPVYSLSRGINGPDLGSVTDINAELNKTFAVVNDGTDSFVMEWGGLESAGGVMDARWDFFHPGVSAFYDIYSPARSPYKVSYPRELKGGDPLPGVSDPGNRHGYYIPPAGGILAYDIGKCNPIPERSDYKTAGVALLQSNVKNVLNSYGAKCVLLNSGNLVCAGGYDYGRHATNPPNGDKTPHLVTTISGVEMLGSNAAGFFAVKNGELWAWGHNNSKNSLGDPAGGFTAPFWGVVWQPFKINLPPGVTHVSQGGSDEGYHMCAVVSNSAYCWGANDVGQLGDGTNAHRKMGNPVIVTW